MKGVTQSYNMFDTHLYKKASKMREKILKENAGIRNNQSHETSFAGAPLIPVNLMGVD